MEAGSLSPEQVEIVEQFFNNGDKYTVFLPSGGGQAIRFSPTN